MSAESKQIMSYSTFLDDYKNFKKNPANQDIYDVPSTFYFKIMFYFNNPDAEDDTSLTSNLLGTGSNSALNFLNINGETERAIYLKDFINLLSHISTDCPWYFKTIEGLDVAADKAYLKEFKFEEVKSINIKCLADPIDNRITTLLDLYNAACYSHVWKREIIPANLRKFDMGIYLFQAPFDGPQYSNIEKEIVGYRSKIEADNKFSNCKYFEFHNCEIDPSSIKSCYASADNEKGFAIEPTITITYDDCYVSRYNEDLVNFIGDLVQIDMANISTTSIDGKTLGSMGASKRIYDNINTEINSRVTLRSTKASEDPEQSTIAAKMINSLIDKASVKAKQIITKAALGNVYGFSLANAANVVAQYNSGDMIGAVRSAVKQTKKTVKSISSGTVISDTIPSIVGQHDKSAKKMLGNVAKNIIRNL